MLLGEQIPPLVKGYLQQKPAGHSWLHHQVRPHMSDICPAAATRQGPNSRSRCATTPRHTLSDPKKEYRIMVTTTSPDLTLHRGIVTTLDRSNPRQARLPSPAESSWPSVTTRT